LFILFDKEQNLKKERSSSNYLYDSSKEFNKDKQTAYERLGCAILCQTIKDLRENEYEGDIDLFVQGALFESIVRVINMKPNSIRQKLQDMKKGGAKPFLRNPYRSINKL
jgi:hypothetical protein